MTKTTALALLTVLFYFTACGSDDTVTAAAEMNMPADDDTADDVGAGDEDAVDDTKPVTEPVTEPVTMVDDVEMDGPPCADGSFGTGGECTMWTVCEAGTYVATAGSATTDRTCKACDTGTFSDAENAESCAEWSTCETGELTDGTATSDHALVFADPKLEAAVREALEIPDGTISPALVAPLTELKLDSAEITDLARLECFSSLSNLSLHQNAVTDLSPLTALTTITELELGSNALTDLSALSGLTSLSILNVVRNAVADASPLAGLTSLTEVKLNYNQIVDLAPLVKLTSLTKLHLSYNEIVDVSPLPALTELHLPDLGHQQHRGHQSAGDDDQLDDPVSSR